MIRQIFLLVISINLLISKSCIEYNAPDRFEEASDELIEFIDEHFLNKNISFFPSEKELKKIGLIAISKNTFELPNAKKSFNQLTFPIKFGLWRYAKIKESITQVEIAIKEPTKLTEVEAFNTYNDLLGGYFRDYEATAYKMTLMPQDISIRYKKRYFELTLNIYGIKDDATPLKRTVANIIFRDLTFRVNEYKKCKGIK